MSDSEKYTTDLMIAYGRGYKDGRSHERLYLVQLLWDRALLMSKSFPELSEGLKIAAEVCAEAQEHELKKK